MNVSLIVCHTQNRVIGAGGAMPWHLPADLKRFKRITLGHPVVMGRKTFESLGAVAPLPGRRNIVLSRNGLRAPGCAVVSSLEDLQATLAQTPFFVIGGEALYRLFLPHAACIHRTLLDVTLNGDAYFPALNESEWETHAQGRHEPDEQNCYGMRFDMLIRR